MLPTSRFLAFTLLFAFTLLIAFASQADASASPAPALAPAHRRQANRMIRKRQIGIIGVGEDPNAEESGSSTITTTTTRGANGGPVTTTSTSTTTTSPPVTTPPTTTTTSTTTSTSTSTSTTSSSTTSSETPTSTTSTSSSTSTSSTESSTSATSTTSEVLQVTSAPEVTDLTSSSTPPSTSTVTNIVSAAQESASESAVAHGASSSVSGTTITVLAAVGGSIVGIAIIWTIIRKWKFRPSAGFEDRMQPIDWSPEATNAADYGLNRSISNVSHGSFHSGSDHGGLAGPRPYNPNAPAGLVSDLPAHDFTAGPAHLGGGYADLHRGPSPGPQMSSVSRGPSFNRGYGY